MNQCLNHRQFLRIAAVGLVILIVVLAIVQTRRGSEAGIAAPLGSGKADALVSDWTRCRTVTLDQTASLETCRQLWAENRRQFLTPSKTTPSKATPAPAEPLADQVTASGKMQDRLLPDPAGHQHGDIR